MSSKAKAKALAGEFEDDEVASMLGLDSSTPADPEQWSRDKNGDLDWAYTARSVKKWSHDALLTHLWDKSFSIPQREYNPSAPFVWIQLQSGDIVTLPHGYRLPLMFVAKYRWEITLTKITNERTWKAERANVLHLSRLCENLFRRAQAKASRGGMEKGWRCVMFDRLLARFYKHWPRNDPEGGKGFLTTHGPKEYDRDVLKHDWKRWCLRGLNGVKMTDEEVTNGITIEQFRKNLRKGEDGIWMVKDQPLSHITTEEPQAYSSSSDLTDYDMEEEESSDADAEGEIVADGDDLSVQPDTTEASQAKRPREFPVDEDEVERESKRSRIEAATEESYSRYRQNHLYPLTRTLAAMARNPVWAASPSVANSQVPHDSSSTIPLPVTSPERMTSNILPPTSTPQASTSDNVPQATVEAAASVSTAEIFTTFDENARSAEADVATASQLAATPAVDGSTIQQSEVTPAVLPAVPPEPSTSAPPLTTSPSKFTRGMSTRMATRAAPRASGIGANRRGTLPSRVSAATSDKTPSDAEGDGSTPAAAGPSRTVSLRTRQAKGSQSASTSTIRVKYRDPKKTASASSPKVIIQQQARNSAPKAPAKRWLPAPSSSSSSLSSARAAAKPSGPSDVDAQYTIPQHILNAKALELLVNLVDAKQVLQNKLPSTSSAAGGAWNTSSNTEGDQRALEGGFRDFDFESRFSSVKEELVGIVKRLQSLEKETREQRELGRNRDEKLLRDEAVDCHPSAVSQDILTDQRADADTDVVMGNAGSSVAAASAMEVGVSKRAFGETSVQTEEESRQQGRLGLESEEKRTQAPTGTPSISSLHVEMQTIDNNSSSEPDTDMTMNAVSSLLKEESMDPRTHMMTSNLSLLVDNLVSVKMVSVMQNMVKGKAKEGSVSGSDAPNQPSPSLSHSPDSFGVVASLLEELRGMKEEARAREQREKEEMQAMRELHSAEVDALRRRLSYLESQNRHNDAIQTNSVSSSGGRYRSSSSHPEQADGGQHMSAPPGGEPLENGRHGRHRYAYPNGHRQFSPAAYGPGENGSSSSKDPPPVRIYTMPTPTPSERNFSFTRPGSDRDDEIPLPIKSQRKQHIMAFPRPHIG